MLQPIERALEQLTFLEPLADQVQKLFGDLLQQGGDQAKMAKDALNGVWFEHPLHLRRREADIVGQRQAQRPPAAFASGRRVT